jgi:hypothetical protein
MMDGLRSRLELSAVSLGNLRPRERLAPDVAALISFCSAAYEVMEYQEKKAGALGSAGANHL